MVLVLGGCGTFETYKSTKVEVAKVKPLPEGGRTVPENCGNGVCDLAAGETVANCAMDCSLARVASYNKQTLCENVEQVFTPALMQGGVPTIDQQIDQVLVAVADLNRNAPPGAARRAVRVIGRAHTSNEQLCGNGFAINTQQMTTLQEHLDAPGSGTPDPNLADVPARIECWQPDLTKPERVPTVVVAAGVQLFQLNTWLQQTHGPDCSQPPGASQALTRSYSLGFAVPQVREPSVAGAASTGTHGSAPGITTMISTYVEEVWGRHVVADTTGAPLAVELHASAARTGDAAVDAVAANDMRGLRAGIGMLGVITRLRFRLQDSFAIQAWGAKISDEGLFRAPDGPFALLKGCEFGYLNWFPSHHKLVKTCGKKAPHVLPGDLGAQNNLLNPPIPEAFLPSFSSSLRYGVDHTCWNCILEGLRLNSFFPVPVRDFDGQADAGQSVVGPSYLMMSSVLSPEQKAVSEEDWEIAVPAQNAVAVLRYAKDYFLKHSMCFPLIGIFLRFGRVEDATVMAHVSAGGAFKSGDPMMYFEMVFYEPTDRSEEQQAALRAPYMEVARTLIEQYGARPHWGKSRIEVIQMEAAANGGQGNYDPASRGTFQDIAAKYDPLGVFQNDFGIKAQIIKSH